MTSKPSWQSCESEPIPPGSSPSRSAERPATRVDSRSGRRVSASHFSVISVGTRCASRSTPRAHLFPNVRTKENWALQRNGERAPISSGREKAARCYSLSPGGAYFVTPRPWIIGSEIALELPVDRGRRLVAGTILSTNVGDPTDRHALPRGMAIAFRPLSEHIQQTIREDVTATHRALEV